MVKTSISRIPFRVPARFVGARLSSLHPTQMAPVLEYAAILVDNLSSGQGLLLSGQPGVGKTWALAALTKEYVDHCGEHRLRLDYEFVTAPDMFENLVAGEFGNGQDDYRQKPWTMTYTSVPWLVINDLGKEFRGGKLAVQVPTFFGRILRTRSERKLVTHITTNLTREDLTEAFGETLVSLISEMMTTVVVTGKDRRRDK